MINQVVEKHFQAQRKGSTIDESSELKLTPTIQYLYRPAGRAVISVIDYIPRQNRYIFALNLEYK